MSDSSLANTLEVAFNKGIEEGWAKVFEYCTDVVDSHHVPGVPGRDGAIPREVMIEIADKEYGILQKVMPDIHLGGLQVEMEEGDIVIQMSMNGTLPEGEVISLGSKTTFSLKEGRIFRIVAIMQDLESIESLQALIMPMMLEAEMPRMPDIQTSEMKMNLDSIASALEAAYNESMEAGWGMVAEYYADLVEVRHVPPAIGRDGFISREKLFELADMEFSILRRAMPDIHLENVHVTVDGEDIVTETTMVGTTHKGKTFSMTLSTVISFKEGRIYRGVATTLDLTGVTALAQMVESMMVESGVPRIVALILRIPLWLVFSVYKLIIDLFIRKK